MLPSQQLSCFLSLLNLILSDHNYYHKHFHPPFSIVHYKFIPQSCREHCVSNCFTIVATKTNPNSFSTLVRKIQVKEYLRLQRLTTGDLGYLGMESIPKKTSYLVPSLTLVEETPDDSHPTDTISYLLKQRVNSTSTASPTYKMYVCRF